MEVGLTDCLSRLRAESGNGKACDALHTSRFCTSNPSITDIRRYNLCGSALGRLDGDTGRSAGRGPTRTAAGRAQTGRFHDRDRRSARRRRAPDHRCRVRAAMLRAARWCSGAPWCVPVSHVRAVGCVRRTITGVRAVRSPRAPRSGLWRPRPPRHGPVRRRRPATAGTTPIQAGPRVFGTSVHNGVRLEWAT